MGAPESHLGRGGGGEGFLSTVGSCPGKTGSRGCFSQAGLPGEDAAIPGTQESRGHWE
jgi:hypothetical protein